MCRCYILCRGLSFHHWVSAAWVTHLAVHYLGPSSWRIPGSLLFHPGLLALMLPPSSSCPVSGCWTWGEPLHPLWGPFLSLYQWLLSPSLAMQAECVMTGRACCVDGSGFVWLFRTCLTCCSYLVVADCLAASSRFPFACRIPSYSWLSWAFAMVPSGILPPLWWWPMQNSRASPW